MNSKILESDVLKIEFRLRVWMKVNIVGLYQIVRNISSSRRNNLICQIHVTTCKNSKFCYRIFKFSIAISIHLHSCFRLLCHICRLWTLVLFLAVRRPSLPFLFSKWDVKLLAAVSNYQCSPRLFSWLLSQFESDCELCRKIFMRFCC